MLIFKASKNIFSIKDTKLSTLIYYPNIPSEYISIKYPNTYLIKQLKSKANNAKHCKQYGHNGALTNY